MKTIRLITPVVIAAVAMLLALPTGPAAATGFLVTKTADTMDFVCNSDCSLREALYEVNNVQGPHSIDLPGGGAVYQLTIGGSAENAGLTGDLDIANDVEIFGDENPIIEMVGQGDRVFHITGGNVVISGVTIRGGAEAQGGGILNSGNLTLWGVTMTGNQAVDGGGILSNTPLSVVYSTFANNTASEGGGGLFSYGSVYIADSTFSGNRASRAYGGGIYLYGSSSTIANSLLTNNTAGFGGGGIHYEGGTNSLTNSTISNNSAGSPTNGTGGAISQLNATTVVTSSIISGNHSVSGGGIGNLFSGLTIVNTSIFANSASFGGGGLYNYGTATVTNSTISGNGASNRGGGVWNSVGTTSLVSSTVNGNTAVNGSALYNDDGILVKNTIIASGSGGNCGGAAAVTSSGFNLSSDGSCAFSSAGDINNAWPALGPLALNGGSTPNHALLDGSPAADGGGPGCPATDQRGVTRPKGVRCDIGAYEAPDTDADGASDPIDSDDDNDGIPDGNEPPNCRTLPEDTDSYQDTDGCPDPDNDGDGVCDAGQTSVSCTGSDFGKTAFYPTVPAAHPHGDPAPIDCRNMPEDFDAFKDSDGCPEPDNDNDGRHDGIDTCPGTGDVAGPDGVLGSSEDDNHNGRLDAGEDVVIDGALTTDDGVKTFEDYDGVIDGDGCHDSPTDDYDGDSFSIQQGGLLVFRDEREVYYGTNPEFRCAVTAAANDEAGPDHWPFDFNDDQIAGLTDVIKFIPVFNTPTGSDPAKQRFDLNGNGTIGLTDVQLYVQVFNTNCVR